MGSFTAQFGLSEKLREVISTEGITPCPRCKGEYPLILKPVKTKEGKVYTTKCCGSDLNELIEDYGLKLKNIVIEN